MSLVDVERRRVGGNRQRGEGTGKCGCGEEQLQHEKPRSERLVYGHDGDAAEHGQEPENRARHAQNVQDFVRFVPDPVRPSGEVDDVTSRQGRAIAAVAGPLVYMPRCARRGKPDDTDLMPIYLGPPATPCGATQALCADSGAAQSAVGRTRIVIVRRGQLTVTVPDMPPFIPPIFTSASVGSMIRTPETTHSSRCNPAR